jgi:hypothetical protein
MRTLEGKGTDFLDDPDKLSNLRSYENYEAVEIHSMGGHALQVLYEPIGKQWHINLISGKQHDFMVADNELEFLCSWIMERINGERK